MTKNENEIADNITKVLSEVIELLGTTDHNRLNWSFPLGLQSG